MKVVEVSVSPPSSVLPEDEVNIDECTDVECWGGFPTSPLDIKYSSLKGLSASDRLGRIGALVGVEGNAFVDW